MKQTSIDALNNHLFEAIEMLKNNNDPKADQNEKIDIETAKAISGLGKVIVDGYKVKAQVLNMMSRSVYVKELGNAAIAGGIISENESKELKA